MSRRVLAALAVLLAVSTGLAAPVTVSPGSWAPLGSVHCRAPLTERWATSATGASGLGWASTTPPAETARAVRTVSFPAW